MRMALILRVFVIMLAGVLFLAAAPSAMAADCGTPDGFEGDVIYNDDFNIVQFCDGTNWVRMGSGSAQDARLGTLQNSKWCATNGSGIINCDQDAPNTTITAADKKVIFADGANTPAGAANLVWLKTFNSNAGGLRVGSTSDPTATLDVTGTAAISGNATFDTNTLFVDAANNRVGVGSASPGVLLALDGTFGDTKLAVFESGASKIGFGVQSGEFRFHVNAQGTAFKFLDAPAGNTVMTIKTDAAASNVGIGPTAPATLLHMSDTASTGTPTFQITGTGGQVVAQVADGNNGAGLETGILQLLHEGTINVHLNAAGPSYIAPGGGSFGIGTATPNASAILDVTSTSKGFLPPRMTDPASAISGEVEGLIAYDTDDDVLKVYTGTTWAILGGATGSMVTGWPDAIKCNVTTPSWGQTVFYNNFPAGNTYRYISDASQIDIDFNSDGTWNTLFGITTTDCNGKNIATLYSEGKAFNFVSGGGAGGGGLSNGDAGDIIVASSGASLLLEDDIVNGTELADTITLDAATTFSGATTSGLAVLHATSGTAFKVTNTGSGDSFIVEDAASTDSTAFVIDTDGDVGIGVTSVAAPALMELVSTTKGFLPPRMTAAQVAAISSPVAGLLAYDTDNNVLKIHNGSAWSTVSGVNNTQVSGWPDGIRCTGSAGSTMFNLAYYSTGSNGAYYLAADYGGAAAPSTNSPILSFASVSAAGTLSETASWTNYATNCNGKTFAQLYATGQAFNFVGGATAAAAGAAGQVQFYSGGNLAADSGLVWDNANKRLNLTTTGTLGLWSHKASGTHTMYITNDGAAASTDNNAIWFAKDHDGTPNWAGIGQFLDGGLSLTGGGTLSTPAMHILDTNQVGIGNTAPERPLSVTGIIQSVTAASGYAAGDGMLLYSNATDGYVQNQEAGNMYFYNNGSERMRIKSNGHVSIGGHDPARNFSVNGIIQATDATAGYGASDGLLVYNSGVNAFINNNEAGTLGLYTSGLERMVISSAGQTSFKYNSASSIRLEGSTAAGMAYAIGGTTIWESYILSPSNELFVYSTLYGSGVKIVPGGVTWVNASDLRLKKNIKPYPVLDRIGGFQAVSFDWKPNDKHDVGVVAQELYKIFPELVDKGDDDLNRAVKDMTDEGAWSVNYTQMSALAMQGVKELKDLFDDLAAKVTGLSVDVGALKAENEALKAELKALRDDVEALKAAQ